MEKYKSLQSLWEKKYKDLKKEYDMEKELWVEKCKYLEG